MFKPKRLYCAALGLSVYITACATIENPEDCDIRCGFGANDRFEMENEERRKELQELRSAQGNLDASVAKREAEKARLVERAAELKSDIALQAQEIDRLKQTLQSAAFQARLGDEGIIELNAEIALVEAEIERLRNVPDDMTETEMRMVNQSLREVVAPAQEKFSDMVREVSLEDNF